MVIPSTRQEDSCEYDTYGLKNYKSKSNSNFFSFSSICNFLCFIFQPIQFALNQVLWDLPWRISPYPRAEMSYYHVLSKIWTVTKSLGFITIGQLFWLSTKLLLQEMLELEFRMKVKKDLEKIIFVSVSAENWNFAPIFSWNRFKNCF